MAKEIERKFLVAHDAWRENIAEVHVFRQGYLNYDSLRTVRVRASEVTGYLTIKGITEGLTRDEFEYEIPFIKYLGDFKENNIITIKIINLIYNWN